MSGIYIPDVSLPVEGDFELWIAIRKDSSFTYNIRGGWRDGKHKVVPVPEHGELIDREQILDAIILELAQANAVNDMENYDSWRRFFDYVRKFPTIIPAEEGEI